MSVLRHNGKNKIKRMGKAVKTVKATTMRKRTPFSSPNIDNTKNVRGH